MGLIAPSLPVVGQPNSTEEPKIVTVESQLLALVNGNLDAANLAADAVTTIKIANNAVTAAKIEAQQSWQTLSLSGFTSSLQYMKDSLGFVHFRGNIMTTTNPAAVAGATLGTLPAGYRPGVTIGIPCVPAGISTIPKPVTITVAGVMTSVQTMSDAVDMSFVAGSFRAEN